VVNSAEGVGVGVRREIKETARLNTILTTTKTLTMYSAIMPLLRRLEGRFFLLGLRTITTSPFQTD